MYLSRRSPKAFLLIISSMSDDAITHRGRCTCRWMNFTLCSFSSVGGPIEWVSRANLMIVTFNFFAFHKHSADHEYKKYFLNKISKKRKPELFWHDDPRQKFVHSRILNVGQIFLSACSCYRGVSRLPKDQMSRRASAKVYATARCRRSTTMSEQNQFYDEFITMNTWKAIPFYGHERRWKIGQFVTWKLHFCVLIQQLLHSLRVTPLVFIN